MTARPDGFAVHDDGPGFPPGLAEHAFERFARGDAARHREGGVGLGLALVEAIVDRPRRQRVASQRPGRHAGRGAPAVRRRADCLTIWVLATVSADPRGVIDDRVADRPDQQPRQPGHPDRSGTELEFERAEARTAHNYHPLPVVVAHAEGAWMTDVDGRRFLDLLAGYSALNFGHSHPRSSPRRTSSSTGSR